MGYIKFFQSVSWFELRYIPFFYDYFMIMERKSKWDKEYQTSFLDEVIFLKSKGIRYAWVYSNADGISVWKYKKEKQLWLALAEMYSNTKYEI